MAATIPPAPPPTRADVDAFDALASLLEYPREGFVPRVHAAVEVLTGALPGAGAGLSRFLQHVEASRETDLEEQYTRTFDWNPTRCLEVGWHLFGEQYDRGAFLVAMRDRLRRAGVEEGTELPDHLTAALRLLPRMPIEEARVLATMSLVPALDRMVTGFDEPANPYADVLRAAREAILHFGSAGAAEAASTLPPGGA